jgi:hypothetical protein
LRDREKRDHREKAIEGRIEGGLRSNSPYPSSLPRYPGLLSLPPFPLPILQKVVDDRQNVSFAFLESLQNQYPPLDGCHHCTLVYVPVIKLIN